MGTGVAQNLAQRGMRAVVVDVSETVLTKARETIFNSLRVAGMFRRDDAPAADPEQTVGMIEFTTDYTRLADVEFVVENVVEKLAIKTEIYPRLDAICPPECIFAANTSAISITKLGGFTKRPDKVLGMHFMNPVPMKSMVEVIRGHHTSDETLVRGKAFLAQLGKEAVVVNDMPGFVSNRVLMLTVNEAVWLVQDQVASAADVDKIFAPASATRWGRWRREISSAWIRSCTPWTNSMRLTAIPNSGVVRCFRKWWTPACMGGNQARGFTSIRSNKTGALREAFIPQRFLHL